MNDRTAASRDTPLGEALANVQRWLAVCDDKTFTVPTQDIAALCVALSESERRYSAGFIRDAIDEEPECPGDMPDEMWDALRGFAYRDDREGMVEAFRIAVRQTKSGIKDRLFKGIK